MTVSLKVKICGITSEKDALAACRAGADLLGFNLVPGTKRYLAPDAARPIIRTLPPFVTRVGVFADEEAPLVNEISAFLGLDAVQLHGHEDPAYCARLEKPVIKAVRVGSARDLRDLAGYRVAAFLLDSRVPGQLGGTGRPFPWQVAVDLCRTARVIVAGGLTHDNVAEAIRTLSPYGVDTASGVERSPAVKDHELMEKFIQAARRAAAGHKGGGNHVAG